jgi:RecJ-like exonuclease
VTDLFVKCWLCDGTGTHETNGKCGICHGTGEIPNADGEAIIRLIEWSRGRRAFDEAIARGENV